MHINPNPSPPPDIHMVFPASEMSVRCALVSLRASLKAIGVDDPTNGIVEMILAEVANNIVEHAYPQGAHGTVTIACTAEKDLLKFEVSDHGKMLPGGEIPAKKIFDLEAELDALPEGGFGWGMIRDLTSALAYKRCEGRNVLRFDVLTSANA